ncbi:hypothetical protein K488DRAFT_84313 [Vararia minispora EC-137]|uniref:Uncharacterized protein n=1 Tax=Vararia minispora EC-137 TaxID=1314806 RepID=A0ACB8QQM6_9AGAM|nr:hypothetical protein K488DRAFT_84313 [Vararia minispora EC-137]
MADELEQSDILGSSTPVALGRLPRSREPMSWPFLTLLGVAAICVFFLLRRVRAWYLDWTDRRRRLAVRRRHGIPDTDHRPFNVAYAAVQLARDEKKRLTPLQATFPEAVVYEGAQEGLRHRQSGPDGSAWSEAPFQPTAPQNGGFVHSPDYRERELRSFPSSLPPIPGSIHDFPSPELSRYIRHELSPSNLVSEPKTHPSGSPDRPANSNPGHAHGELRPETEEPSARKPKRMAESSDGDDGEEPPAHGHRRMRDKRRRKVSNLSALPIEDDDMEIDGFPELPPIPLRRGKKRDRAEAGSTMGDDDDAMEMDDGDHKHRTIRRRHRKSQVDRRGRKRERGSGETSEEEDGPRLTGRQSRMRHDDDHGVEDDDVAMSDTQSVRSTLTVRGHRIGEEWEAHGLTFRIGPDGQRLTKALIKADQPLYPMPQDSSHPDREALVEVVRELWLSDQEFREAKDRQMLAWQSPMKPPPSTPRQIRLSLPSSFTVGKELLWNSLPSSPKENQPQKFGSPLTTPVRIPLRLASTPGGTPPPVLTAARRLPTLSTTRTSNLSPAKSTGKGYTKLQKQEIEAEAQESARRKREERIKAIEEETRKKAEEDAKKAAATMPPPAAPTSLPVQKDALSTADRPSTVPTLAPNPSASIQPVLTAPKAPFSFAPSTSSPLAVPPRDVDKSKTATPSASSAPSFSFPSATPALSAPGSSPFAATLAPSTVPHTSSSIPNFFAKPVSSVSTTPNPTISTPSDSSVPNFFANDGKQRTPAPVSAPLTASSAAQSFFAKSSATASMPTRSPSIPAPSSSTAPTDSKPVLPFASPTSSPAPPPSLFKPAVSSDADKTAATEGPKLKFSFSAPSTSKSNVQASTSTTTPAASTDATKDPVFTFSFSGNHTTAPPAVSTEKKDETPAAKPAFSFVPGAASRGMFGKGPAATGNAEPFKSAFGTPAPAAAEQSTSIFSASRPQADAGKAAEKPASMFGTGLKNGLGSGFGGANGSVFGANASAPSTSESGDKPAFTFDTPLPNQPAKSAFGTSLGSSSAPSPFGAGALAFGAGTSQSTTASLFGASAAGATSASGAPAAGTSDGVKPGGFSFTFGKPSDAGGGAPAPVFGSSGSGGASAFGFGDTGKKN